MHQTKQREQDRAARRAQTAPQDIWGSGIAPWFEARRARGSGIRSFCLVVFGVLGVFALLELLLELADLDLFLRLDLDRCRAALFDGLLARSFSCDARRRDLLQNPGFGAMSSVIVRCSMIGRTSTVACSSHCFTIQSSCSCAFSVGDLATTEAHGELHLVAGFDEALRCARLEVEIVIVRLRAQLDLFDVDDGLLALGFAAFFFSSYLNLPKSRILQTGGSAFGFHLDEVEPSLLRPTEGFVRLHDAEHLSVVPDNADLGDPDSLVDSDLRSPLGLSRVEASHGHVLFRCLLEKRVTPRSFG